MVIKEYVSQTLAELKEAADYQTVDALISQSIENVGSEVLIGPFLAQLEERLEDISPLDCNSTQWSCYRYALICLNALIRKQKTGLICH